MIIHVPCTHVPCIHVPCIHVPCIHVPCIHVTLCGICNFLCPTRHRSSIALMTPYRLKQSNSLPSCWNDMLMYVLPKQPWKRCCVIFFCSVCVQDSPVQLCVIYPPMNQIIQLKCILVVVCWYKNAYTYADILYSHRLVGQRAHKVFVSLWVIPIWELNGLLCSSNIF